MGIYGMIVTIVYVLSVLGLAIATVALLLSGLSESRDYRELARRLMAIAAGAIASGVALLPIYKLLADFAKGADPISPRALLLGGLMPGILGATLGILANRLLKERNARSTRLLILLNAAVGTYLLIGLAGIYTIAQSQKDLASDVDAGMGETSVLIRDLEDSVKAVHQAAYSASNSFRTTERRNKDVEAALDDIRTKIGESSAEYSADSYTLSSTHRSLNTLRSELERASTTLRAAIRSQGTPRDCKVLLDPCVDALLASTSKAAAEASSVSRSINELSANIGANQAKQIQESVIAILPNLVLIMTAFLMVTLSKE